MCKEVLILIVFLLISGCASSLEKEQTLKEGRKETTTAVSETDIQQVKSTPLFTVGNNAQDVKVDLKIEGGLPKDKLTATVEKEATESTILDMNIRQIYKSYSAWIYIIMLVACAGFWYLYKSIVNSKEGRVIMGGLSMIGKAISPIERAMHSADPTSEKWTVLNDLREEFKDMQSDMRHKDTGSRNGI